MALLSCLLGYGEVGLWLKRESERLNTWVKMHDNPYEKWIEDYSGEGYQAAVKLGLGVLILFLLVGQGTDELCQTSSRKRLWMTRLLLQG